MLATKLLNSCYLLQHVTHPIHDSGYTIDLVITNASSKIVVCSFFAQYINFRS